MGGTGITVAVYVQQHWHGQQDDHRHTRASL
jgi:hypothetical protein